MRKTIDLSESQTMSLEYGIAVSMVMVRRKRVIMALQAVIAVLWPETSDVVR